MVHLIVQLSKYIMIILFLIYTFLCFHLFKYPDKPKKQRHIYNLQRLYVSDSFGWFFGALCHDNGYKDNRLLYSTACAF